MRLPDATHTSRPWLIHSLVDDFALLDVWALPTPGGRDDFHRLVELISAPDDNKASLPVRALMGARWAIGRVLGWDSPSTGIGVRVRSVRARMPDDLRSAPRGPRLEGLPFEPLYLVDSEWALEIANRTVHGILHVGWVEDAGTYRGEMAIYVKPEGAMGRAYLAAIGPFRHWLFYPLMMRDLRRAWKRVSDRPHSHGGLPPVPPRRPER